MIASKGGAAWVVVGGRRSAHLLQRLLLGLARRHALLQRGQALGGGDGRGLGQLLHVVLELGLELLAVAHLPRVQAPLSTLFPQHSSSQAASTAHAATLASPRTSSTTFSRPSTRLVSSSKSSPSSSSPSAPSRLTPLMPRRPCAAPHAHVQPRSAVHLLLAALRAPWCAALAARPVPPSHVHSLPRLPPWPSGACPRPPAGWPCRRR